MACDESREHKTRIAEQIGCAANPHQRGCVRLYRNAGLGGASNESKEACARATLIGCFVRPEEVAHAVIFIAENDALAGQVLTLDGATSLKGIA